MMGTDKNFIVTFDKSTADKLQKEGYMLVDEQDGRYTFLNDGLLRFSEKDCKYAIYTNMLSV